MDPGTPGSSLADRAQSRDPEELLAIANSHALTEEIALSLLTRRDLPANVVEAISKNTSVRKHRKVNIAIASHPRTPRHISLPLTRHLYTFDLVKIALLPGVPADVKVAIDETVISRLAQISEGERLTLAKQASGRVAGALLQDTTERVLYAALQNPKMTESIIIKALGHRDVPAHTVLILCTDAKWALRRDIRLALLRNSHTPLAAAIKFVHGFPEHLVREVLSKSKMKPEIKKYLLASLDVRS
ncbi:hypothetical protein [Candidatus Korobacter versatilis]|nr:hypothetical protein [Candidatus Koribacter versatilis]